MRLNVAKYMAKRIIMNDVIIIGGGIIGAFIAHELSHYKLKITLLEKDNDVANETTMANSAIIHTGYDPKDGTLKAKLNPIGHDLYKQICKDLDVPYKEIGAYVVAFDDNDINTLEELKTRAINRNIIYEELYPDTFLKQEPNLNPEIKKVLSFPTTAIIDPMQTCVALIENAIVNGLKVFLNQEVKAIEPIQEGYKIKTQDKEYQTKYIINCAGINSNKIAKMIGDNSFDIIYRKGEYYVLDKKASYLTKHIIYPCPSTMGKGVLIVPTVHGNTLLGPTAFDVDDSLDTSTTLNGLEEVKTKVQKLIKDIPFNLTIRTFAGLRAKGSIDDFIIYENENHPHFINVAGIDSPGIASAPAIAKYVIDNFFNELQPKENFIKTRKGYYNFDSLDDETKAQLIKENPKFGHIICRCEKISEQEIIDCIHRPLVPKTIKAIKKRIRPGMGRCQGGFCAPLVIKILARELNINPKDICYDSINSNILKQESKGDEHVE